MAYAMTKQGSLDNCVTYEFICDTLADMNAIENKYRTIGSVAVVLQGESGMEAYIAGSDKQWNNLGTMGANGSGSGSNSEGTSSLSIYICAQNEVSNGKPNIASPDENTIYLVSAGNESGNLYEEYIYVNNAWEKFGAASIDLSGYAPIANPIFTGNISLGRNTNYTNGTGSFACGYDVVATGNFAHAEGSATRATGDNSHAEGAETEADGPQSHAEGVSTRSSAQSSHAEGVQTTASFVGAHAEGNGTTASQTAAHAEGMETTALGVASHAEGSQSTASGQAAHAEGMGGTYTSNSVTYTSNAVGTADHIEGYQCLTANSQPGNHAEGYQTRATGGAAHAEGNMTQASGNNAHAEGVQTVASSAQAHAEGGATTASGNQAHAEGYNTVASGAQSHAEGLNTAATNMAAHAEGLNTTAAGNYTHVEGYSSVARGNVAHAEGYDNTANGEASHAEGYSTTVTGKAAHSEGRGTQAAGADSHVGGTYNVIDSYNSWDEWTSNTSYAVGDKVKRTTTSNNATIIYGYICKTANNDTNFTDSKWTHLDGQMNYVEIIGNGTTGNTRSNARALDWDGNEYLKGDLYVGCNAKSIGGTKLPRIPEAPSTDGTYILQATVTNGTPTYSWVSAG